MGGSKSRQNSNFLRDWTQLEKQGQPGYLSNIWVKQNNRNFQMQEYQLHVTSADEVKAEKRIHELRHNHPMLVSSIYFKDETEKEFCSSDYKGKIYLERIPCTLGTITDIPYPDALHVYLQSLQGFNILSKQTNEGCFPVSEELIGVNMEGVVKVWMNNKFDRTFPSRLERIEQERMVHTVMTAIDQNVDHESLNGKPSLREYFQKNPKYVNGIEFNDAIYMTRNYANTYWDGQIPSKLTCMERLGGAQKLFQFQNRQGKNQNYQNNANNSAVIGSAVGIGAGLGYAADKNLGSTATDTYAGRYLSHQPQPQQNIRSSFINEPTYNSNFNGNHTRQPALMVNSTPTFNHFQGQYQQPQSHVEHNLNNQAHKLLSPASNTLTPDQHTRPFVHSSSFGRSDNTGSTTAIASHHPYHYGGFQSYHMRQSRINQTMEMHQPQPQQRRLSMPIHYQQQLHTQNNTFTQPIKSFSPQPQFHHQPQPQRPQGQRTSSIIIQPQPRSNPLHLLQQNMSNVQNIPAPAPAPIQQQTNRLVVQQSGSRHNVVFSSGNNNQYIQPQNVQQQQQVRQVQQVQHVQQQVQQPQPQPQPQGIRIGGSREAVVNFGGKIVSQQQSQVQPQQHFQQHQQQVNFQQQQHFQQHQQQVQQLQSQQQVVKWHAARPPLPPAAQNRSRPQQQSAKQPFISPVSHNQPQIVESTLLIAANRQVQHQQAQPQPQQQAQHQQRNFYNQQGPSILTNTFTRFGADFGSTGNVIKEVQQQHSQPLYEEQKYSQPQPESTTYTNSVSNNYNNYTSSNSNTGSVSIANTNTNYNSNSNSDYASYTNKLYETGSDYDASQHNTSNQYNFQPVGGVDHANRGLGSSGGAAYTSGIDYEQSQSYKATGIVTGDYNTASGSIRAYDNDYDYSTNIGGGTYGTGTGTKNTTVNDYTSNDYTSSAVGGTTYNSNTDATSSKQIISSAKNISNDDGMSSQAFLDQLNNMKYEETTQNVDLGGGDYYKHTAVAGVSGDGNSIFKHQQDSFKVSYNSGSGAGNSGNNYDNYTDAINPNPSYDYEDTSNSYVMKYEYSSSSSQQVTNKYGGDDLIVIGKSMGAGGVLSAGDDRQIFTNKYSSSNRYANQYDEYAQQANYGIGGGVLDATKNNSNKNIRYESEYVHKTTTNQNDWDKGYRGSDYVSSTSSNYNSNNYGDNSNPYGSSNVNSSSPKQGNLNLNLKSNNQYQQSDNSDAHGNDYDDGGNYQSYFEKYAGSAGSENRQGSATDGVNVNVSNYNNNSNSNSNIYGNEYQTSHVQQSHVQQSHIEVNGSAFGGNNANNDEEYKVDFDPEIFADLQKLKGG